MNLPKTTLFIAVFIFPLCSFGKNNVDSLKGAWNDTGQSDNNRFSAVKNLAWNGFLQNHPDSAFHYADQYYIFAKRRHNSKEMATALYIQATASQYLGANLLGLEKAKLALSLYQEVHYEIGIANSYNLIGNICLSQLEYDEAQIYYRKALKIYLENNDVIGEANIYNNLGNILKEEQDYLDALNYYFKSLTLKKQEGNKRGISSTYTNIGLVQLAMNDHIQALEYLELGFAICVEEGFEDGKCRSLINISECYFAQNKAGKALEFATNGLAIAMEIKSLEVMSKAYELLYRISKKTGDFKKALEMKERFESFQDSIQTADVRRDLHKMKIQEEYKLKKQADIFMHELEIAEKEEKLAVEKSFRNNLYVLISIIAVFLFGFIKRFLKIKKQKYIIEGQHLELNEAHGELTDSINYAKWIQSALLKTDERITAHLPSHFIYYKPKAIVSGDFYWFHEKGGYVYFCVADCTGHGVPGAFMSMLGISFLQEIIAVSASPMPSVLMEGLSKRLVQELSQKEGGNTLRDGMDASIIRYHKESRTMDWCGANNAIYIVSNTDYSSSFESGAIRVIKAPDKERVLNELLPLRQSVGFSVLQEPFFDYSLNLEKGDMLYLFTDGFADQFGGLKGKKYMQSRLKQYFLSNWNYSVEEQQTRLETEFNNWKREMDQIDDVCIAGVLI